MKIIFATVILCVAGMSASCRVNPPLDPVTMNPSCKFCPQNYYPGYVSDCRSCGQKPIVSSK